ncbi:anti-sigma factor [uncultured Corynebacterium sp.]|uniref:anti-sigma factor family protein n=1 Tax=uncultured Corynebacterium sp. TaxID=159447 RepID=UPI0025F3E155|nr:hypothetical protein [uncultured Corynebacterium sp.]
MFNSDTTGELSSQLREPRTVKKKPTSQGRLHPSAAVQRDAIKVSGVIKTKIVEKTLQAQSKAQKFASVDHLSSDAVAMFVDNELTNGAMHRARLHLVHCADCREEISKQRDTVDYVREECKNEQVTAPTDLKAKLMSLANECSPGPGADDCAIQRPESFVAKVESVVRAVRRTQGR